MDTNEHIEYIGKELKLIVSPLHTFGTDALLLASFTTPKKKETACDFGTGCGIIPFYWLREECAKHIYAVEIQQNGFDQLTRSIELNNIDKITAVHSDLKDLKGKIPFGTVDVVTMNPPYTSKGSGIECKENSANIARHEIMCSFDDICKSASKLLRFGGRLCMCIRPERLTELMFSMKNATIEPKRLRFVSQKDGLPPWLVLIEGKKGRNSGLTVEKELHIDSKEMIEIIGSYRK